MEWGAAWSSGGFLLEAGNFLLRYPGELPGDEVYVRNWDDHGFATQLIHGRLVRKIRERSLARGPESPWTT
jgi:hypothetical protein